ncbi:hypothetical protein D3C85_1601080 [compost metagenome]
MHKAVFDNVDAFGDRSAVRPLEDRLRIILRVLREESGRRQRPMNSGSQQEGASSRVGEQNELVKGDHIPYPPRQEAQYVDYSHGC